MPIEITAKTKTTVVVNLINHKQLFRNSLHNSNKEVYKAASLLAKVPEFAV